jgi:hypothetical protein
MANEGEILTVAFNLCCQLRAILKMIVGFLHIYIKQKNKKPPQPRIELGSPA